jgi:hypothetical protein
MHLTEDDYALLYQRVHGVPPPALPVSESAKPSKYHAKKIQVDGHTFDSLLEAQWYGTLGMWAQAGAITPPLLQVRFSLGQHYQVERVWIADFVWIDLQTGGLVVADAKGFSTPEYKRKRRTFQQLYQLSVLELRANAVHEKKLLTWKRGAKKKRN